MTIEIQLHALLIFQLYFTNPAFHYTGAGLARSFPQGDDSMMHVFQVLNFDGLDGSCLKMRQYVQTSLTHSKC